MTLLPSRGFTLIELIMVVAIIGIMTSVSITKFTQLVQQANQATTKGSLGLLRSAEMRYYTDREGIWSPALADLVPRYLKEMPESDLFIHPPTQEELSASAADESAPHNAGKWLYDSISGTIKINCTHTDSHGVTIDSW